MLNDVKIQTAVNRILKSTFAKNIEVVSSEILRDKRCFRLFLKPQSGDVPGSVILKIASEEPGCPTDPDATAPNPAQAILEEWAGLVFLNEILPPSQLVPRFHGADRETATILIEDFGSEDSLVDVLQKNDSEASIEALLKHADALAQLHSATLGRETRYLDIRNALGPSGIPRNWKKYGNLLATQGWGDLRILRSELENSFVFLGQRVGEDFWNEYSQLVESIHGDSPFRAYVHNDTCPDNSLLTSNGLRLIDFERSGYHHCLLDVSYYRLGMPHCFWAGKLPSRIVNELEARYREKVSFSIPEASDDMLFGRAIADACGYWIISSGIWNVEKDFSEDFRWGNASWRGRVLFRLKQFAKVTEDYDHLPAMSRAAIDTLKILNKHWPDSTIPFFTSFK